LRAQPLAVMEEQYKALYKSIDKIFWEDWDPLDVNEYGEDARDEYYGYIPEFVRLKMEDAELEIIAKRLFHIETYLMATAGKMERCSEIAALIKAI
jgi:hypothetical protein